MISISSVLGSQVLLRIQAKSEPHCFAPRPPPKHGACIATGLGTLTRLMAEIQALGLDGQNLNLSPFCGLGHVTYLTSLGLFPPPKMGIITYRPLRVVWRSDCKALDWLSLSQMNCGMCKQKTGF